MAQDKNTPAPKKKPGFFRWKGIIPFAVIIAGVAVFNMLFLDALLKHELVSQLESVNGAQVDLEEFDFSFVPLGFTAGGLAMADAAHPFTNALEVAQISLLADTGAFLFKKVHVD